MVTIFWLLILLAFPVAEGYVLWGMAQHFGAWTLLPLLVAALVGVAFLRNASATFVAAAVSELIRSGSPARALAAGATPFVAGLLFIFPGVLSDALAIFLLLWAAWRPPPRPPHADDAIEGTFYREE